ncbi:MAG: hypothetical protein ACKVS5_13600 [Parvularculaceae bacterium]
MSDRQLLPDVPAAIVADAAFQQRLLAQMLRDLCVEAVTTYDDMGRLNELKIADDADAFWLSIAELFMASLDQIRRTRPVVASAAP